MAPTLERDRREGRHVRLASWRTGAPTARLPYKQQSFAAVAVVLAFAVALLAITWSN